MPLVLLIRRKHTYLSLFSSFTHGNITPNVVTLYGVCFALLHFLAFPFYRVVGKITHKGNFSDIWKADVNRIIFFFNILKVEVELRPFQLTQFFIQLLLLLV